MLEYILISIIALLLIFLYYTFQHLMSLSKRYNDLIDKLDDVPLKQPSKINELDQIIRSLIILKSDMNSLKKNG
jgi:hypothetical protein